MTEGSVDATFRRKVLNIIELLCDSVDQNKLKECLPFLHGNGWDEVVEERFVNKMCGYPTCTRSCRPNNNRQLYHIDRKSGTIYENCTQRNKFCSDHCFEKSVDIRNQLVDEALWITGENQARMNKIYTIPTDLDITVEDKSNAKPKFSPYKKTKNVELVEDTLKAKISDLRIRDEESDHESIEGEEDEEERKLKHVQPYEKCSDDEDFVQSVQRFVTGGKKPQSQKPDIAKEESPTVKPIKPKENSKKESEILDRLRQKYGKDKIKKAGPVIIDVVKPKESAIESNKTNDENEIKERLKWIEDLVRSWISDETRQLLKEGARGIGGDFEHIFMDFMTGKQTDLNETPIDLPSLDKYNIKEKRLNIFMQSIKQAWSDLEARLHMSSTRRHLVSRTASTFHLNSENITGWNKKETSCIVLTLFLLVCQIDIELEDEYFHNGHMSPELQKLSSDLCKINKVELDYLYSTITSIKNETNC